MRKYCGECGDPCETVRGTDNFNHEYGIYTFDTETSDCCGGEVSDVGHKLLRTNIHIAQKTFEDQGICQGDVYLAETMMGKSTNGAYWHFSAKTKLPINAEELLFAREFRREIKSAISHIYLIKSISYGSLVFIGEDSLFFKFHKITIGPTLTGVLRFMDGMAVVRYVNSIKSFPYYNTDIIGEIVSFIRR